MDDLYSESGKRIGEVILKSSFFGFQSEYAICAHISGRERDLQQVHRFLMPIIVWINRERRSWPSPNQSRSHMGSALHRILIFKNGVFGYTTTYCDVTDMGIVHFLLYQFAGTSMRYGSQKSRFLRTISPIFRVFEFEPHFRRGFFCLIRDS